MHWQQPTAFKINTYELPVVWETPDLVSSLYDYTMSRLPQDEVDNAEDERPQTRDRKKGAGGSTESHKSVLLLQILAAADYFTTNATLMENVPPVHADIILDPYLFNVLPQSLASIAAYVAMLAVISFFIAKLVVSWIRSLASRSANPDESKKDR
jgi:hypothetical protein